MKYTYLMLTLVLSVFFTPLAAQDASPAKEIGLQFSGVNFGGNNSFGVFFKKQKKENVYRRVRFFYGNLQSAFIIDNYALSLNGGLAIGREKRKSLDDKLVFFQGPEFSGTFSASSDNGENGTYGLSGAFGWVLGLQHSFNKYWAINMETIPGIRASVLAGSDRDASYNFSAGFNNTVSIGLVRKF